MAARECATMADRKIFTAFFSYAHHDATTDPDLVSAFTAALENRVNAKLINVSFAVWRDTEALRTGDRWDERIDQQLRSADILIILLTPSWLQSDYCRREFLVFECLEIERGVGEYVAPILVRNIERQEKYLTADQSIVYDNIKSRQYQKAIATDFLMLSDAEQIVLIDKIADDIVGMIDRRRIVPASASVIRALAPVRTSKEFDARAQNYEKVDFLTDGEVVLGRATNSRQRDIFAHVGFVRRLYIQGKLGRIEFGVRRAHLSIKSEGSGQLSKIDELRAGSDRKTIYYTSLHEAPNAVTVCIDPPLGESSLAELPMPPSKNENYLCKVAEASGDVLPQHIKAELIVSLNAEGLNVGDGYVISPRTRSAIRAIMDVVKAKIARRNNETIDSRGEFRRMLPVRERR
jgi:hypothetical protein